MRPFAERCKSELRYCTWLRELHAPAVSRDAQAEAQSREMAKHIDDDIDTQLFIALASSLPPQLAYMRANVEERSRVGSKFSALCLALEGEADFLKESNNSRTNISYLDNHHDEHSANVALATRIAKDPRGVPVTERITESYKKDVSTDYKMKKRDKRRLEEVDDSDDKEEPPKVHKIHQDPQQPLAHIVKDLWNHVMVLDSQKSKFTSQRDLPCFNFAKGNCRLNDCKYSHANSPSNDDSSSSSRRKSAQQSSPPTRYRSRSPRKKQLPVRFQLSPPPPARKETAFFKQSNRGYGGKGGAGGKGGKGYGSGSRIYEVNPGPGRRGKGAADQQEPYTPKTPQWPPNDHPTACFKMYDVSKCSDKDCTSYHGISARDTARDCPALRTKSHCPRLWQQRGCGFYHEKNNHNNVPKNE